MVSPPEEPGRHGLRLHTHSQVRRHQSYQRLEMAFAGRRIFYLPHTYRGGISLLLKSGFAARKSAARSRTANVKEAYGYIKNAQKSPFPGFSTL
jgi:hypothetical protein